MFNVHVTTLEDYDRACFYLRQNFAQFESWSKNKIVSKAQLENFDSDFQIRVTFHNDITRLYKYMKSLGFDCWGLEK